MYVLNGRVQIPGYAAKAPCTPNFIFVAQRGSTQGEEEAPGTTPAPEEPECGSPKVKTDMFYVIIETLKSMTLFH